MRNYIITFSIIAIFLSCNTKNGENKVSSSDTLPTSDTVKIVNDTFVYQNNKITINTITKDEYKKIAKPDSQKYTDTTIRIKTVNDTLRLPLDNGKYKIFTDTSTNTENLAVRRNTNIGILRPFGYYTVLVNHYETGEILLVNKRNGRIYHLISDPILSPDNKKFASVGSSMEYELMPNGLQIWTIDNDKINLDINLKFKYYSFEIAEISWVSVNKIAFMTRDFYNKNVYGLLTIK